MTPSMIGTARYLIYVESRRNEEKTRGRVFQGGSVERIIPLPSPPSPSTRSSMLSRYYAPRGSPRDVFGHF